MTIKEKVKKLWVEHKGKIIVGVSAVGLGIAAVVLTRKEPELHTILTGIDESQSEPTDYGRGILITYSDEETGEVLYKDLCYESYMNDMKECGMQYDNIRALNEKEEA